MSTMEHCSTLSRDFFGGTSALSALKEAPGHPGEPPTPHPRSSARLHERAQPSTRPTVGRHQNNLLLERCRDEGCWTTKDPHTIYPSPRTERAHKCFCSVLARSVGSR